MIANMFILSGLINLAISLSILALLNEVRELRDDIETLKKIDKNKLSTK
jgi:hypothetical protein